MTGPYPPAMNRTLLGILGVALALFCWSALLLIRHYLFALPLTAASVLFELAIVCAGSALFWVWIIRLLNRQAAEVRQYTQHLKSLHEAGNALVTEHDLHTVLQKVVDLSRDLLHARYGALGVLSDDGNHIEQLITSGISEPARAAMQQLPTGHSILGIPLRSAGAIRIDSLAADPRAAGFPPNHPPMHSFVGVPIISKGRLFGNLYLADKLPDPHAPYSARAKHAHPTFTQGDQEVLEMFATQAALAIENANLYRENQQIAVMRERERFGMDLHDGVIQSIYAIGLLLDDTQHRLPAEPDLARQRIGDAIAGLNTVIRDIRSYINDLRSQRAEGRGLQPAIELLAAEVRAAHIETTLTLDGSAVARLSPAQSKEIIQIVREALTNVRKHAHATHVTITLQARGDHAELTIADNGRGFPVAPDPNHGGHGLPNMHARAGLLHGTLDVISTPGHGAQLTLTFPFPAPQSTLEKSTLTQ